MSPVAQPKDSSLLVLNMGLNVIAVQLKLFSTRPPLRNVTSDAQVISGHFAVEAIE